MNALEVFLEFGEDEGKARRDLQEKALGRLLSLYTGVKALKLLSSRVAKTAAVVRFGMIAKLASAFPFALGDAS